MKERYSEGSGGGAGGVVVWWLGLWLLWWWFRDKTIRLHLDDRIATFQFEL